MTMTNDELRALADCLNDPNAMQRTARRKAADYLRAQADAQPVAWLDPVSQYSASQWLIDNMNPEQRADFSVPLYAAPAPTAQREPLSDEHGPISDAELAAARDVLSPNDVRRVVPQREPTEAQIEAVEKVLRQWGNTPRHAFEMAHSILRAALAAKE